MNRLTRCSRKQLKSARLFCIDYICHMILIQQALKYRFTVKKKVRRVIKFKEKSWLDQYISLNTKYKTNAKNVFKKHFYKLLKNSMFGKKIQNKK